MKTCNKCGKKQDLSEYYTHKRMADGKQGICKYCMLIISVYYSMRRRCYNIKDHNYHNYGGRGITMCIEWYENYNSFYTWAVNNGHERGLQLDRIKNNEGYRPSNCRFVTAVINARNKRNNKLTVKKVKEIKILLQGKKMLKKDIASLYGVSAVLITKISQGKKWTNVSID